MKSKTAKVLPPIAGRSMVGHVLRAAQALEPTRIVAVVGHQREQVGPHIAAIAPDAVMGGQDTQEGPPPAARMAWQALPAEPRVGVVGVASGDTPLLEG